MSDTPLSDLITAVVANEDDAFLRFFDAFIASRVGIKASGLPGGLASGTTYRTGPNDSVAFARFVVPDGRTMVKACADPRAFERKYPGEVTALIVGRHLLETALKMDCCEGVLVCSAATFHSVPLARIDIPALLARGEEAPRKPWWRVW